MDNPKYKTIAINYIKGGDVGNMLEQMKETADAGFSQEARSILWMAKGAEYLRNNNASPEKIKKHLWQSLKYYAGQMEQIKMQLQLEHSEKTTEQTNHKVIRLENSNGSKESEKNSHSKKNSTIKSFSI